MHYSELIGVEKGLANWASFSLALVSLVILRRQYDISSFDWKSKLCRVFCKRAYSDVPISLITLHSIVAVTMSGQDTLISIQSTIWDAKLALEIRAAPAECRTYDEVEPYLVSRQYHERGANI